MNVTVVCTGCFQKFMVAVQYVRVLSNGTLEVQYPFACPRCYHGYKKGYIIAMPSDAHVDG